MMSARQKILIGVSILALVSIFMMLSGETGFVAHAERIKDSCALEEDKAACYEHEVPSLYPEKSVEELMELVREIRKIDSEYQFCHVLAHKVGERVVAEDPERWLDAIPLNPADGLCSNGFIHGVVGGRFRSEVLSEQTISALLPAFQKACESRVDWKPSDLDRAICYHGLGHLFTFITDADINRALSVCSSVTPQGFERVCIEGVFMQIYQPLEPDDFALIERMPVTPTKETVRTFCARFSEPVYEGACLRESWPFFRESLLDGTGISSFCEAQPNVDEEKRCYEGVFTIVGRLQQESPEKIAASCAYTSTDWQGLCYERAANAYIEEDRVQGTAKAVALCEAAQEPSRTECLDFLVDVARFNFGEDPLRQQFCASLPESVREQCV